MNGNTPHLLMPRSTILLLPLPPTQVETLTKSVTHQLTVLKLAHARILSLESTLLALKEEYSTLKSNYTTSDRELAMLDGRYKKVTPTTSTPSSRRTTTKKELQNLNSAQLAELSVALEIIMKDKAKEASNA